KLNFLDTTGITLNTSAKAEVDKPTKIPLNTPKNILVYLFKYKEKSTKYKKEKIIELIINVHSYNLKYFLVSVISTSLENIPSNAINAPTAPPTTTPAEYPVNITRKVFKFTPHYMEHI